MSTNKAFDQRFLHFVAFFCIIASAARFESFELPENEAKEMATYQRNMNWLEKYNNDLSTFYHVEAKDTGKQVVV